MLRTRPFLAFVLLALLVFAVACGGDDDDADGSHSNNQTTSGESGGSGSSPESTPVAGSGDSSSSSSGTSDVTAQDVLENCPELLGGFGAFSPSALQGPGEVSENIDSIIQLLQTFADNAPSEIKSDAELLASAVAEFYGTIEEVGVDFANPASFAALTPEQLAQVEAATNAFSDPAIEQASDNLEAWVAANCS